MSKNSIKVALLTRNGYWKGDTNCATLYPSCNDLTEPTPVWVYFNPLDPVGSHKVSYSAKQVGQVSINTATVSAGTSNPGTNVLALTVEGVEYTEDWATSHTATAAAWVATHAATLLALGITATADTGVITFTALTDLTITDTSAGDVVAGVAAVQAAIANIGWYPGIEAYSADKSERVILNYGNAAADLDALATACNGCCDELITFAAETTLFPAIGDAETTWCITRVQNTTRKADAANINLDYGLDYNNVILFNNNGTNYLIQMTSALEPVAVGDDTVAAGACVCP